MSPTELVTHLYTSLNNRDESGIEACYHPQAVFEDPAFGELRGKEVVHMWHMLMQNPKAQLNIQIVELNQIKDGVTCTWTADYFFGKTGRQIHNVIQSTFQFKDGLIIDQRDRFNLYKWFQQALGLPGWLFGWTGFMKRKLRQQTTHLLKKYIK